MFNIFTVSLHLIPQASSCPMHPKLLYLIRVCILYRDQQLQQAICLIFIFSACGWLLLVLLIEKHASWIAI